jgi:single-stranded-DNA-specific exonuclease RecJ
VTYDRRITSSNQPQFPRPLRLPKQRWQIAPAQAETAEQLAAVIELPPLLAQVLINRGIDTPELAQTFLNPEGELLPLPTHEFPALSKALDLLEEAIATRQPIAICGDYDADGMTSTGLLLRALRFLGAQVDYAIPSRMQEGYGINQRIVEEFYREGVRLILTVDNGIAAHAPIARARELGLTIIVTDHHDLPPELPAAHAILNPKLIRQDSPYRGVAGVGVAYILAVCLAQQLRKTQDLTAPLIELFALGTIADLAPLTGVNRRWVKRGLKLLPNSQLPGVQALIQVAGLGSERELKPEAIGFRLGPRINAIGRIADPQIVIDLLTTDDEGRALELAMKCEQINRLRQELCEAIEQAAIEWCEESQVDLLSDRILLVVQPDWHHGVIGIVASRLVERYGVPVFIGTYEDEIRQRIRGSARGIPEFNVFEALQFCGDLLEKFGGHRAAGGFSLQTAHLEKLRSRLRAFANQHLQPHHLKPLIAVDAQADLNQLTLDLYQQIDRLHPCGIENPDPVFWTPNVRVLEQQAIGQNQTHLKLIVAQDGGGSEGMKAIAWRWGEYCPLPKRVDIAYRLRLNNWNGSKTVELELVGVRLPVGEKADIEIPEPAPEFPNSQQTLPAAIESQPLQADPSHNLDLDQLEGTNLQHSTPTKVDFYYNKRKYSCSIAQLGSIKELRIKNPEGKILAIQAEQQRGLLGKRREDAQEVDISQPHYFNLIRAALNALDITDKDQLLKKKDRLIADKNQQIATLRQQLNVLTQDMGHLPLAMQQQLQSLQTNLQTQEETIKEHETQISELQSQLNQVVPNSDIEQIKHQVRSNLGDLAWSCLSQTSQNDLLISYEQWILIQSERFTAPAVDYSEAGLRLSFAVEREILHPFFKNLHQFLLDTRKSNEISGMNLGQKQHYTLAMLPPLLATHWYSFRDEALRRNHPSLAEALYYVVSSNQMSQGDRHLIKQFLQTCEHPVVQWLMNHEVAAASTIDQINKLRTIAAQPESFLYEWQFELLSSLIIGNETRRGIFQDIHGNPK